MDPTRNLPAMHSYPPLHPPPPRAPPPPSYPRPTSNPSMPMPNFHQQTSPKVHHALPGQVQLSPSDSTDRARQYKSRNKRPCDFCRYKKAACHLDSAPPCELCIRFNKECTFVESPAKRRRPNEQNGDGQKSVDELFKQPGSGSVEPQSQYNNGRMGSMDMQHEQFPWNAGSQPFQIPHIGVNDEMQHDFPFGSQLYHEPMTFESFQPMSASTTTPNTNPMERFGPSRASLETTTSPQSQAAAVPAISPLPFDATSGEPSLDRQHCSNAQIVGISGESDPYLLSKYRYDEYKEATFQSVRIRTMNMGSIANENDVPTFFTIQHNALASKAQPQEKTDTDGKWRKELEDTVGDEIGRRLIRLFYHYVQPYFPILCDEWDGSDLTAMRDPQDVPPCVLAAIYGHALAFCAWDDKLCVDVYTPPSADALFKIAWKACQSLLHTPSIAVIQTLLLLVQRRPTNRHVGDTPFKWVMMTTAVGVAQALGLNRDPTDWQIPSWEVKQRKRLAWAVFVQDKWLALNFGRSSHIIPDDWDIPLPTEDDFPGFGRKAEDGGVNGADHTAAHFIQLCRLTTIVDDILRNLFSIKATKQLHNRLEATLEVAKPLRIRLTEWYQAFPPSLLPCPPNYPLSIAGSPENGRPRSAQHQLDGHGSLQLAYITAKIELFRAMLRPRVTDGNAAAVTALRTGAIAVAKEISEFLDSLQARELEAFWASYARTNFTIASSFMLLLFVTSPTIQDAKECLALLNAWRSLLRIKSRSCDLLNLALLRLDNVFVAGMERLIDLSPAAQQAWIESGAGT